MSGYMSNGALLCKSNWQADEQTIKTYRVASHLILKSNKAQCWLRDHIKYGYSEKSSFLLAQLLYII